MAVAANKLCPSLHLVRLRRPLWACFYRASAVNLTRRIGMRLFWCARHSSDVTFLGLVGAVSSSRPEHRWAPRAAAVNTGRRPPPKAARSGVDGREHGASLNRVGRRVAAQNLACSLCQAAFAALLCLVRIAAAFVSRLPRRPGVPFPRTPSPALHSGGRHKGARSAGAERQTLVPSCRSAVAALFFRLSSSVPFLCEWLAQQ